MTKISIIIVSWNTSQLLSACLQSILQQVVDFEPVSVETIVVDNASTDNSVQMMRQEFPWVHLLENANNLGFAAANNQAMGNCTGEYIWLVNPDTVLLPGAMAALLKIMGERDEAGAAGSCLLNVDGTLQQSCSPTPTLIRELWRLFHLDSVYAYSKYPIQAWQNDSAQEVDIVQGASLIVRREVVEQTGLFDTDYFMYSEEVDLCHRIRSAGWKIYWVPQSRVVHYGGQSTQQVASAMFLQLYQSKILYFRKRQGEVVAQVYKAILLMVSVARLALTPLTGFEKPNRRKQHMALAGNYLRLVLNLHKM
jgi:N-acetylglucosaminyl-diphospho-decaprenol L-rhamnosyltransferase